MKRFALICLFLFILAAVAHIYFHYFLEKKEGEDSITLYGNVDVRQVDLGFRVKGRVDQMSYQEGEFVSVGQLIATLDKQPYVDLVLQAKAQVESIEASLKNTEQLIERRRTLIGTGAISSEEYEDTLSSRDVLLANLKEAQAALGVALTNLQDTEIYAPNDGTILTRIREPGSIVREADPVYILSLISPIWIRSFVAEPELGEIYPGMMVEIFTDTKEGKVYQGHIGFISPVAEFTPKSVETTKLRTDLVYRLRIIAENPDKGLRQGMPVTLRLKKQTKEIL
ncbi:efflux RND transporter periplasmic adaptor subunit [Candidatus Protochlamydia sp. W-9]|uniref:efflux RND transporter periplasmic adaptor subunit n=1 Tax=Candidatus Protochlamydia sp. W-9 TaxID=1785087 RepID=UPI00096A5FAA|nr:efflux RND transporter periplasmic adaptor subunit [Candidatus Protochlamydia sp. W-9]